MKSEFYSVGIFLVKKYPFVHYLILSRLPPVGHCTEQKGTPPKKCYKVIWHTSVFHIHTTFDKTTFSESLSLRD